MLNGIDISSHQEGINLDAVDFDFAVIKATQGQSYVNPYFKEWANKVIARRKKLGLYHYIGGNNVYDEVEHFYNNVKDYVGKALFAVDWEQVQNPAYGTNDYHYCKDFCDAFYRMTGVRPLVYFSYKDYDKLAALMQDNFGLWVARYRDYKPVSGYLSSIYKEDEVKCAIRQYTSAGNLAGYDGFLDLNKFYGNGDQWDKYTAPDKTETLTYRVGEVYTVTASGLAVRKEPGTTSALVGYKNLTADGKKHDSNKNGYLDKGTKITCKDVKVLGRDIWVKCPSGWLGAYVNKEVNLQ